jgi:hypothetical protein
MRSYHNHEDGFYVAYRAMGRALHQSPLLAYFVEKPPCIAAQAN